MASTVPSASPSGFLLKRLFPTQVDNRFDGYYAAFWLLGLLVALKLVMSVA